MMLSLSLSLSHTHTTTHTYQCSADLSKHTKHLYKIINFLTRHVDTSSFYFITYKYNDSDLTHTKQNTHTHTYQRWLLISTYVRVEVWV